jgi:hypothetical protein
MTTKRQIPHNAAKSGVGIETDPFVQILISASNARTLLPEQIKCFERDEENLVLIRSEPVFARYLDSARHGYRVSRAALAEEYREVRALAALVAKHLPTLYETLRLTTLTARDFPGDQLDAFAREMARIEAAALAPGVDPFLLTTEFRTFGVNPRGLQLRHTDSLTSIAGKIRRKRSGGTEEHPWYAYSLRDAAKIWPILLRDELTRRTR